MTNEAGEVVRDELVERCCFCAYAAAQVRCEHEGFHFYCAEHDPMPGFVQITDAMIAEMRTRYGSLLGARPEEDVPEGGAAAFRAASRVKASMTVHRADGSVDR